MPEALVNFWPRKGMARLKPSKDLSGLPVYCAFWLQHVAGMWLAIARELRICRQGHAKLHLAYLQQPLLLFSKAESAIISRKCRTVADSGPKTSLTVASSGNGESSDCV
jgi:hypothetical protein